MAKFGSFGMDSAFPPCLVEITGKFTTRALASCLIGAAIWLAKTLLIKLFASNFQSTRFFDRV